MAQLPGDNIGGIIRLCSVTEPTEAEAVHEQIRRTGQQAAQHRQLCWYELYHMFLYRTIIDMSNYVSNLPKQTNSTTVCVISGSCLTLILEIYKSLVEAFFVFRKL